jgi:hypothetical protein
VATSETEICNLALVRLGDYMITSLDEESTAARYCALFYAGVRDAVLRDYPWNFAIRKKALALADETPVFGHAFMYGLPSDCIRALDLRASFRSGPAVEFSLELNAEGTTLMLCADEPAAILRYVARIEDPSLFDAEFVEAVSWKLAADLAQPITGDSSKQQAMLTMYRNTLVQARQRNAVEGRKRTVAGNDFVSARR